jgi:hypothetical protein
MARVLARRRGSVAVIDDLRRELTTVGIRGRARDRILAEFEDHLACDPEAQLGDARTLARQFADELGSDTARRSAFSTFGALAVVAFAVGVPQLALPTGPDLFGGRSVLLVGAATLAMVIGAQVAFAAGCLAALRALRAPRDVSLVRRRTGVALAAGAATALGGALYAVNFWGVVPPWWGFLAVAAAAAAAVPLGASALAYAGASRIVVSDRTPPRGLSTDLGSFARPVLIGVGAVAAMTAATAVLEGSLVQGLLRGAFEGLAFAVCFVAFRRYLALSG